ncbi:MAG: hypothetical protein NTW86_15630 [Candidatus Sumerlaeota bacterium]|nr:hypothetical protein [Candidatus Sumerlaeota bacterium]
MKRGVAIAFLAGGVALAACHGTVNPRPAPAAHAAPESARGAGPQGGEEAISAESLRELYGGYVVQLTPPRRVEAPVSREKEPPTRGRRVRAAEPTPTPESPRQPLTDIEPEEPTADAAEHGFVPLSLLKPTPAKESSSSQPTKTSYVLPKYSANARATTVSPTRTAPPSPPRVVPPLPPLPPIPLPQPPVQAPTLVRAETGFGGAPAANLLPSQQQQQQQPAPQDAGQTPAQ